MTKKMPSLRKTASTADLYMAPSDPQQPRHMSLGRSHTTTERPRPMDDEMMLKLLENQNRRHGSRFTVGRGNRLQEDEDPFPSLQGVDKVTPPPVPPKRMGSMSLCAEGKGSPRTTTPSPLASNTAPRTTSKKPEDYTKPFCDFMTNNPTIFHAVDTVAQDLESAGYKKLDERDDWDLEAGGQYYVCRNGSSLIAFSIGDDYKAGNGAAMIAGHIDALTAKLKPISKLRNKAGFVQLGVAPYAGALNSTWWDRDLGIGGRVLVKEGDKVVSKLVKLDWPIARIPTLAPHFGAKANGPFNLETEMVPVIGIDNSDLFGAGVNEEEQKPVMLGGEGSFASTQPEKLVRAIAKELGVTDYSALLNWELELFDTQPAVTGGIEKDFIFAGRIDDKLCSWAAIKALLNTSPCSSGIIKLVALFDDEEVGSLLRQGARGNFLPSTISRILESFTSKNINTLLSRTYANSFLVSSDVIHAVNPNFLGQYLENHSPRLNIGPAISYDSNAHMTTDSVSAALYTRCVENNWAGAKVQAFQIRNDSRSGGTVGPMLSSAMGVRAIDTGIPQWSMHSIRATTGSRDPGLGVASFQAFLEGFERVDEEFRL
ncbi:hypothetical protein M011DRAFT_405164 [Sporormia fimetaria CBS 119925]|uniref:Aspartyl aminopeptidase n=1 Tax=Sporormia fimetaria CBS 119925 TaxID=1340428 RepID=A0A6A6V8A8_9PLEO|nr:hypothetical protein M011DRAFT_405164 [Sporormia fimetaria CBS 119925]